MSTVYEPPVDQLLARGEPDGGPWPDYVTEYGFTEEHVPALIQLATDGSLCELESEDPLVWAPLHAWRALGQLRAEEAVEPLLGLLWRIDEWDDDWAGDELPEVIGMIG